MKLILGILITLLSFQLSAQVRKKRVPSYFGIRVSTVFPTRFIGEPRLDLASPTTDSYQITSSLQQKIGYSFGGTVRVGLTKLIALETGINFTHRNFDLEMAVPDSNVYAKKQLAFIDYDIPINALFYIPLSEQWYMNASLGAAVVFKPTHIGTYSALEEYHEFKHTGFVEHKIALDLNANVGFEFRTEKNGFFYLGGSGKVPFQPIFDLYAQYAYQGTKRSLNGGVDGTYLSIDFKYFFPIIKKKGEQFRPGPIVQ